MMPMRKIHHRVDPSLRPPIQFVMAAGAATTTAAAAAATTAIATATTSAIVAATASLHRKKM
jgi:hypothetical protein